MYITREEYNEFMKDYNMEITEITKEVALCNAHIERLLTIVEAHQEVLKGQQSAIKSLRQKKQ